MFVYQINHAPPLHHSFPTRRSSDLSNIRFSVATEKALHPGQSALIHDAQGQQIGVVGALHPELIKSLGIVGAAYVFELSLDRLLQGNVPTFKALSKFPQIRRDLALLVDTKISAQDIMQLIQREAGELLQDSFIFDLYQGKGIAEDKKSLALALIFQHAERSLQDDEVQGIVDGLLDTLVTQLGATLRI